MMKLKEEGKSLVDRAALSQLLTLRNRIVKARGIKKSGSDVTPPVPMPATGPWPTFNFGGTGPSSTEKKGDEEPSKEGFKFEALTPIEPTPLPPIPKFDFKFEFGTSGDKDKEKKSEGSSALQPATFAFEYKPIEFNFNFDKKEEPTAFEQKEELGEKRDYAGIIKATQDQTKVLGENVAPPSEPVLVSTLPRCAAMLLLEVFLCVCLTRAFVTDVSAGHQSRDRGGRTRASRTHARTPQVRRRGRAGDCESRRQGLRVRGGSVARARCGSVARVAAPGRE